MRQYKKHILPIINNSFYFVHLALFSTNDRFYFGLSIDLITFAKFCQWGIIITNHTNSIANDYEQKLVKFVIIFVRLVIMILATNKKAYFDYEALETIEAGVVLTGPEVKSVKKGQINLVGSYVTIDKDGVPWLINVNIAPYPPAWQIQQAYNPTRSRKLLLKKKEIDSLIGKSKMRGLTIIPLKCILKGGLIKIEIGLCRGKKKWDKREQIKKREIKRKMRQELK